MSRIGAIISKQSKPLNSQFDLIKEATKKSLEITHIDRPEFWSGFCVKPNRIEFWQEGKFRLHQRSLYSLIDGKWQVELLYP